MIGIGLLGYGTVGQAFAELLNQQTRIPAQIKVALVRSLERRRQGPRIPLTLTPEDVITRSDIDVVVDVMGGQEPARDWIIRAMRNGKSVISANKEVMAKHGPELLQMASRHGVFLAYEAAVGGGVPLLDPLRTHFTGAPVSRFVGILNGTTNYILSRLEAGDDFAEALREAQAAGYAEADPTNDLDGTDIARKLALVYGVLFGPPQGFERIPKRGLDDALSMVVRRVQPWGWRVKVLALANRDGGMQISPTLVPKNHHLARVDGVTNAVGLEVADQWFWLEGPGAGGPATSLSLLADLYRGFESGFQASRLPTLPERRVEPLVMPWLAFALDRDRYVEAGRFPDGSRSYGDYWITPALPQIQVDRWLVENPGLLAYPVLLDA